MTTPSSSRALDWSAIKARAGDLRDLVAASIPHAARRGDMFACPFHEDRTPSMSVRAERFRCFSCGASGDAIDWLVQLEGITPIEAARRLDPTLAGSDAGRPHAAPGRSARRPGRPEHGVGPRIAPAASRGPSRDPAWQEAVEGVIATARDCLRSAAGAEARRWLRSRGISDSTALRFGLGFNPEDYRTAPVGCLGGEGGRGAGIFVPRGVVIPWPGPRGGARWVGAAVRRLSDPVDSPLTPWSSGSNPKVLALKGSTRGHLFPGVDLPGGPVLIVEGELDALVGAEALGRRLPAVTVGGASTRSLPASTLAALGRCDPWLIATDHDGPGVEFARWLAGVGGPRARRVILPFGKDLAEFAAGGGDLSAWLDGILGPAPPPPPFDLAGWLEHSRRLTERPGTNLSAIAGGFTFDDDDDIAEAEARRLERAGLI